MNSTSFFENSKELQACIPIHRREHSYFFLVYSRLDRNMNASIGFDHIHSFWIFSSAVNNELWPSKWSHCSVGNLKRQIPVYSVLQFANSLESKLACSFDISICYMPVFSCHKVILDWQSIKVQELAIVNLPHTGNVEIAIGLSSWIVVLHILMILVVVFFLEFVF